MPGTVPEAGATKKGRMRSLTSRHRLSSWEASHGQGFNLECAHLGPRGTQRVDRRRADPDMDVQERLLKWSVAQCVNDRSERREKIILG